VHVDGESGHARSSWGGSGTEEALSGRRRDDSVRGGLQLDSLGLLSLIQRQRCLRPVRGIKMERRLGDLTPCGQIRSPRQQVRLYYRWMRERLSDPSQKYDECQGRFGKMSSSQPTTVSLHRSSHVTFELPRKPEINRRKAYLINKYTRLII
jgi:hypothetical protein